MRLLLSFAAAVLVAAPSLAQQGEPDPACDYETCALIVTRGGWLLSPVVVRGADSTRVAGGGVLDPFWGPRLSPLVASSPEATAHARTYERTRAPQLAAVVVTSVLLNALIFDGLSEDRGFLNREAGIGVAVGAALSHGVSVVLTRRANRAFGDAIEAYNAELQR